MKHKFVLILFLMTLLGSGVWVHCHGLINVKEFLPEKLKPASLTFSREHLDSMVKFAKKENYNSSLGIFINFKRHSGTERFFLVNLETGNIIVSGLCCHGHGGEWIDENVRFANIPGSSCSSEGFYKIGQKYVGRFGTSYKLHGLCATNCNAFERFVVLHAHDCVPTSTVAYSICESEGCPTLAPEVLRKLIPYLDESEKPVVMWIYKY